MTLVSDDEEGDPSILSLPLDSLYLMASFLTPEEWSVFAKTSSTSKNVWHQVLRRVRLHGFTCATEIVAAWRLGELEDAKELAALYLRAGVPIYPYSLGLSYGTLLWRMHEQAREIDPDEQKDTFYSGSTSSFTRSDFRATEDYTAEMTYAEEKTAFWRKRTPEGSDTPPDAFSTRCNKHPTLRIHRHLLDQHVIGKCAVDDQDGDMLSPPICLSADFYHPPWYHQRLSQRRASYRKEEAGSKTIVPHVGPNDFDVYNAEASPHPLFAQYKERLEDTLARREIVDFDETLLDFWDEFMPKTAGAAYYDGNTAVPRLSRLDDFASKPCPKSFGIVQCEIERIRVTSKGKGVKSRLFPTYEYALFIRHRSAGKEDGEEEDEPTATRRRDTLLMVAKGRSRTFSASPIASSKKGSNNFHLHLPKQSDVDEHYQRVNESPLEHAVPNGACFKGKLSSEDDPVVLGRLQSNFVGTEFQLLVPTKSPPLPTTVKEPKKVQSVEALSEDEIETQSAASTDVTRRSRFALFRRGPSTDDESWHPRSRRKRQMQRVVWCPEFQSHKVSPSRPLHGPDTPADVLYEADDTIVMYTANLLGSRPRIMDVCVPKVDDGGAAGTEWREHLEKIADDDETNMFSVFKDLLNERDDVHGAEEVPEQPERSHGLLLLQNRPPWWNVEVGSFVLNFGGRVSVASVKNFQLCDPTDQDRVLLQFGRIQGRHSFTMDFQHPLSAVQAFSIAISSLQSKISFG